MRQHMVDALVIATESARSALQSEHHQPAAHGSATQHGPPGVWLGVAGRPEKPPPGEVVTTSSVTAVTASCGKSVTEAKPTAGSSTNCEKSAASIPLGALNLVMNSRASQDPAMPAMSMKSSTFERQLCQVTTAMDSGPAYLWCVLTAAR